MFQGWENVYYLMGPAAAGLIGLMFIALALTNNFDAEKAERGQRLFMTPTVMQLAITVLVSSLALAPSSRRKRIVGRRGGGRLGPDLHYA